jgi:hypothetical protein
MKVSEPDGKKTARMTRRRKRHRSEQIVRKLHDADAMLNASEDEAAVRQSLWSRRYSVVCRHSRAIALRVACGHLARAKGSPGTGQGVPPAAWIWPYLCDLIPHRSLPIRASLG